MEHKLASHYRPLIRNAVNLLRIRLPVAPDVERVAADLEAMLDGKDAHAVDASAARLDVAEKAGSWQDNPFNALCWVNQTTFPVDLENGLVSVGASEELAREISSAYQLTSDRNLMRFYEEHAYATSDADWQKYLSKFFISRMAQWPSGTHRSV